VPFAGNTRTSKSGLARGIVLLIPLTPAQPNFSGPPVQRTPASSADRLTAPLPNNRDRCPWASSEKSILHLTNATVIRSIRYECLAGRLEGPKGIEGTLGTVARASSPCVPSRARKQAARRLAVEARTVVVRQWSLQARGRREIMPRLRGNQLEKQRSCVASSLIIEYQPWRTLSACVNVQCIATGGMSNSGQPD